MYLSRTMMKPVALACTLALAACSSGDDAATGTTTTTVTGLVQAPGGQIAQFQNNRPVLLAVTDMLFPPAAAAITGLDAVPGATVVLIRIDDDGNQVGEVLAQTSTSSTGNYSLALPAGVSLAGNLIVRITGNSGTSMSAMVVDRAVDINPISQYVLDKFIDDENLVLGNLALNEVVALQGRVEEFDLSADGETLTSMLAQLEAEVGELVDAEIATIKSTPDNGAVAAALAGTWNSIEFGLGMTDTDAEPPDGGSFHLEALSEGFTLAPGASAGEVSLTAGNSTFIDAWSSLYIPDAGNPGLYLETSLGEDDSGTYAGLIDNAGNIVIDYPFEEELETVDVQQNPAGPEFGWRFPPGSFRLSNAGNHTMVYLDRSVGVRYQTMDTNGDFINDAVDPTAKAGDEAEMFLGLLLKQGSNMSADSLLGAYGLVTFAISLDATSVPPVSSGESTVGVATFDGVDTVSLAASALDDYMFERSPADLHNVALTDTAGTDGGRTFPYSVTQQGQVTLDTEDNGPGVEDLQGWTNDDGSVIGLLSVIPGGTAPNVDSVYKEMTVALKLPASAPAMGGAVFKLYPIAFGADQNGLTELDTLGINSSLTFNATATEAEADFILRGFERGTDIGAVQAISDPDEEPFAYTVNNLADNGAIDMSFTDLVSGEVNSLDGFVSADGSMMVLRMKELDDTAGQKFRALGIVIAVRQ